MRSDPKILKESVGDLSLTKMNIFQYKKNNSNKMRKIIELLSQLIISTTIFGGIFYVALPKYDHEEAQNTLRNHFTIMFRVQQGLGMFRKYRGDK